MKDINEIKHFKRIIARPTENTEGLSLMATGAS